MSWKLRRAVYREEGVHVPGMYIYINIYIYLYIFMCVCVCVCTGA